jgi:hypothetical protein
VHYPQPQQQQQTTTLDGKKPIREIGMDAWRSALGPADVPLPLLGRADEVIE